MIKTKKIKVEEVVEEVLAYQCDKCKTWYDNEEDWDDAQEFHRINFTGGYGSVFGDGTNVECDLCQKCLHAIIKDCMRTKTVW